ncbi:MAG: methylmalonyl Co-A mutase-associated GTPase MeaB [Deltaproteobacteria bacterium]|nr:methylmalonyl Co-A mutase-associated GTPase MeaB [Deltaproteobacteria bacterium]MBW2121158.1 methylmalonyl Co-A mutase-associated GTPase MeaB [Deltaproteobacteria bacterium]
MTLPESDLSTGLAERILRGDVRAAARLMRDIDDDLPGAWQELKRLYPRTGRAYIVGITGSPGSGKSTLVDKIIEIYRKEGKTVGIVAVDPSSPFTGGAILGDRIRMQRHSTDEGVFIRSLATRGYLGGISRSTHDVINVMDAMGKDIIIVETVGVGQDEVDIVNTAHTSIVVSVPGLGDEVQVIKAGILEIADIFVINKCEREGAERLEQELRVMMEMAPPREDGWVPPIFKTEAVVGKGIFELVYGISRHRNLLVQSDEIGGKNRLRAKKHFLKLLQVRLLESILSRIEEDKRLDQILQGLADRKANPYTMVEEILNKELKTTR